MKSKMFGLVFVASLVGCINCPEVKFMLRYGDSVKFKSEFYGRCEGEVRDSYVYYIKNACNDAGYEFYVECDSGFTGTLKGRIWDFDEFECVMRQTKES